MHINGGYSNYYKHNNYLKNSLLDSENIKEVESTYEDDDYYSHLYDVDGTPKELSCVGSIPDNDCFRQYELYEPDIDEYSGDYQKYDDDDLEISAVPVYNSENFMSTPYSFNNDLPKITLLKDNKTVYLENIGRVIAEHSACNAAREAIADGYDIRDVANIVYASILKEDISKKVNTHILSDAIELLRQGYPVEQIIDDMSSMVFKKYDMSETYHPRSLLFLQENREYCDFFVSKDKKYSRFDDFGARKFKELSDKCGDKEKAHEVIDACRISIPGGDKNVNSTLYSLATLMLEKNNYEWSDDDTQIIRKMVEFSPMTNAHLLKTRLVGMVENMLDKGVSQDDILKVLQCV